MNDDRRTNIMIERRREERIQGWGDIAADDPLRRAYANLVRAKAMVGLDQGKAAVYARRAAALVSYAESDVVIKAGEILKQVGERAALRELYRFHALAAARQGRPSMTIWAAECSRWAEWDDSRFESDPVLETLVEAVAKSDPIYQNRKSFRKADRSGQRRIRIGYMLDSMASNTVRNIYLPLFKLADRSKYDIYLYSLYSPEYVAISSPASAQKHADCLRESQPYLKRLVIAPPQLSKFQAARFIANEARRDGLDIISTFDPSEYTYLEYALSLNIAPYCIIMAMRTPTTFKEEAVTVHGFVRRGLEESGLMVTIPTKVMEVPASSHPRDVRASLGIPPHAQLTVSIGQTVNKFRSDEYWQLLRFVLEHNSDYHHLILGDVPSEIANKHILREVADRVHFMGQCFDVLDILAQSNVCIDTLRTGAGGALVECYKSGLVSVGFDDTTDNEFRQTENCPGIEHIHIDNRIPRWDIRAFANRVVSLLENENLRKTYAAWAKGRYADHRQDAVVRAYESLYSELARGEWDERLDNQAAATSNGLDISAAFDGQVVKPLSWCCWEQLLVELVAQKNMLGEMSAVYLTSDSCATGLHLGGLFKRVTIVNYSQHLAELVLDGATSVDHGWTDPRSNLRVTDIDTFLGQLGDFRRESIDCIIFDWTFLETTTLFGIRIFMHKFYNLLSPNGKFILRALVGRETNNRDAEQTGTGGVVFGKDELIAATVSSHYKHLYADFATDGQLNMVFQKNAIHGNSEYRARVGLLLDWAKRDEAKRILSQVIEEMMRGASYDILLFVGGNVNASSTDVSSMCHEVWNSKKCSIADNERWKCEIAESMQIDREFRRIASGLDIVFYNLDVDRDALDVFAAFGVVAVDIKFIDDLKPLAADVCKRLAVVTGC